MNDRASIRQELRKLVADEFYIDVDTITDDTEIADFGLDSISLAEFLFLIEDHFKVDLGANMKDIATIGEVITMIIAKRSATTA